MKIQLLFLVPKRAIKPMFACLLALPSSAYAGGSIMFAGSISTVMPLISSIEGANMAISTITSGAAPSCDQADQSCKAPGLADLEPHATCVAGVDDYLENDIKQASDNSQLLNKLLNIPLTNHGDIKTSCILSSMQLFEDARNKKGHASAVSNYAQCSSGRSQRAVKPCMSENYDRLVVNSYELVSKCMASYVAASEPGSQAKSAEESDRARKLDMEAIFGLVNQESGFHITAESPTGSAGEGQMSGDAIADVNKSLKDVRAYLESNSADSDCAGLSQEFLKTPMSSKNRCERTSVKEGNPIKNLIYMFAYLHGNRKSIESNFLNSRKYASKLSQLSANDKEKLSRALMVWAHNTGGDGISTPLTVLLNRTPQVTDVDQFLAQLQSYVKAFPARANRRPGRPEETSKYYPTIQAKLADLNKNAGAGSCEN